MVVIYWDLISFTTGGYNLEIKKSHNLQKHYNHTTNILSRINVYSFALKPEEHQPSGSCNFSRIDTAQLITGGPLSANDKIYAVNYNGPQNYEWYGWFGFIQIKVYANIFLYYII